MIDLLDKILIQQATYCKEKNIKLNGKLEQKLAQASDEDKAEAEIALVEAEYILDDVICQTKKK